MLNPYWPQSCSFVEPTVFERDSEINPYISQSFLPKPKTLATPELLILVMTDKIGYQHCYAIGSEIWFVGWLTQMYILRTFQISARDGQKKNPISRITQPPAATLPNTAAAPRMLTPLRTNHWTWGDRAFAIADPCLWNSLPRQVHDCTNLN